MTVYVTTNDLIVSDDTVRTLERSLPYLGSGVSRRVHDLGNGQVLKLGKADGWAGGNQTEYDAFQRLAPEDRQHFAAVYAIADDGTWMVAEKIGGGVVGSLYGDDRSRYADWQVDVMYPLARKYGIRDLHDQNVGMRNDGSFAILDYAMGGGGGTWSDEASDNECGCSECNFRDPRSACGWCGDCDCEACKPDGCDCPSLVGCNVTYCGISGCQSYALAQRLTVRWGGGWTMRKRCNVHGTADKIQLRGQGILQVCWATFGAGRVLRAIPARDTRWIPR